MARYIDADALIEQMEADAEHMDDFIAQMMLYASIHDVKHAQTADVVERKKGMWNIIQGNIVVCSVCGMNAPQSMTGCLINRHLEPNKSNFCPNCGADMRKEVE